MVDRDHLQELLHAPNNELNFIEAIFEDADYRYIFPGDSYNMYHSHVIRTRLTQNIPSLIPDMVDEMTAAFGDEVESKLQMEGVIVFKFAHNRLDISKCL